jgi:hypothetical protein
MPEAKPEVRLRIIDALIRIMTREGHTSSSRHNCEAAEVLLALGHWEPLLAFYNQYQRPDSESGATGVFVLDLIRLLSDRAIQDLNFPLMKHLMLTAYFGFQALGSHPLVGGSPQLKAFGEAMASARRIEDLVEVCLKAVDQNARNAARAALAEVASGKELGDAVIRLKLWEEAVADFLTRPRWAIERLNDPLLEGLLISGHQETVRLVRLVAEKGILEALTESNRNELVRRYQETLNVDRDFERRIQKYFRKLLHQTRTAAKQAAT